MLVRNRFFRAFFWSFSALAVSLLVSKSLLLACTPQRAQQRVIEKNKKHALKTIAKKIPRRVQNAKSSLPDLGDLPVAVALVRANDQLPCVAGATRVQSAQDKSTFHPSGRDPPALA
jgi:hypothetical protein